MRRYSDRKQVGESYVYSAVSLDPTSRSSTYRTIHHVNPLSRTSVRIVEGHQQREEEREGPHRYDSSRFALMQPPVQLDYRSVPSA